MLIAYYLSNILLFKTAIMFSLLFVLYFSQNLCYSNSEIVKKKKRKQRKKERNLCVYELKVLSEIFYLHINIYFIYKNKEARHT